MDEKDLTKMCQFCDGNIPLEAATCPFCAADVMSRAKPSDSVETPPIQEGIEDRFAPPYTPERALKLRQSSPQSNVNDPFADHKAMLAENEKQQRKSKFAFKMPSLNKEKEKEPEAPKAEPEPEPEPSTPLERPRFTLPKMGGKKTSFAILLLSLGVQLFTIGLLILFFSVDGQLTLQWAANRWYLYCLIALPFIGLGWYSIKALDETMPQEAENIDAAH